MPRRMHNRSAAALAGAAAAVAGCSPVARTEPGTAVGSWTLEDAGDAAEPITSTMTISPDGFDRTTVIATEQRQIEVNESGGWTALPSGEFRLDLEDILLVVTQPGDVSVETYVPPADGESSARLRVVGDRLVLEMLLAGEPVARYAYRRD